EAIAANATYANNAIFCNPRSLDPTKVKGKIRACAARGLASSARKEEVVKQAGRVKPTLRMVAFSSPGPNIITLGSSSQISQHQES
ncbi:hypothetical protein ACLOJK_034512, partial [Asimina triloba]